MSKLPNPGRHTGRVRHVRLPLMSRIRGGFRGLLAAIATELIDPEDPAGPEELRWMPLTSAEHRARELRAERREKADRKRAWEKSPF
jgi:hypothetical protein